MFGCSCMCVDVCVSFKFECSRSCSRMFISLFLFSSRICKSVSRALPVWPAPYACDTHMSTCILQLEACPNTRTHSLNVQIPNAPCALSPQFVDIAANKIFISLQGTTHPHTHTHTHTTAVWWVWNKESCDNFILFNLWLTRPSVDAAVGACPSKWPLLVARTHTPQKQKRNKNEKAPYTMRHLSLFCYQCTRSAIVCMCMCVDPYTRTHIQTGKYVYICAINIQHAPAAKRRTVREIRVLTAINL